MPVSNEYLQYVLDQLSCIGMVDHKRMFGGVGFYFDGSFFGLIDDDVLYFKVDDATRGRYERAGATGFDPYKDGRPSIGYFSVPVDVLEDRDELRVWAMEAIDVARRAPTRKRQAAKAARKKRQEPPE
ncbi:MAG TPA: TfoX/Sxy family protein [Blastocatellia bacterium]|nr:TfoX/Sxy family protein [Blastocatellia bacterium]